MAIQLVAHAAFGGATSGAVNTVGANLIVLFAAQYTGTPGSVTVSDSQSNTWTQVTFKGYSGQDWFFCWYCLNPSTSSGQTFTQSTVTSPNGGFVLAFSGVQSYDSYTSAAVNSTTTITMPSLAANVPNELFVAAMMNNPGTSTPTISAPFTVLDTLPDVSNSSYDSGSAYCVSSSAQSPTWTFGSGNSAAIMASFKPAAGGGSPISSLMLLGCGS